MKAWLERVQGLWSGFTRDGGGLLAAAVAYNALFALAPALMLVVVAARLLLGREAVVDQLIESTSGALGPEVAAQLAEVVNAYLASRSDRLGAGIIGGLLLVWALGGMFAKLQQAFDMLWHVRVRATLPLAARLRLQASRFLFALLPVALAVAAGVAATLSGWIARLLGLEAALAARIAESPLTLVVVTWLALVVLYRLLPYAHVSFRDVVAPAAVVAVVWTLFTVGFGLFLARGTDSPAGAAGSVFVLLLWLNYSAMGLLLGCSACRRIAEANGRGGPSEYAEPAHPHVGKD